MYCHCYCSKYSDPYGSPRAPVFKCVASHKFLMTFWLPNFALHFFTVEISVAPYPISVDIGRIAPYAIAFPCLCLKWSSLELRSVVSPLMIDQPGEEAEQLV